MIRTDITFHGIDHSDAAEAAIHRWVSRMEHFHDRIEKCAVVVQRPHKRHRHGGEFSITIVLSVPGPDIAVSHVGHEDLYLTIADAFRAAKRQLVDRVAVTRGFVKTHVVERTGNIGVNLTKHRAGA
jgi:putative sigma-54 modulation protein